MNDSTKDIRKSISFFAYRMRYCLRFSITGKASYLQADLDRIPALPDIAPCTVKEIDVRDPECLKQWIEIIEDAYTGEKYTLRRAEEYFQHHRFLENMRAYFFMNGSMPIATVAIGVFRDTPHVGGEVRLAVKRKYHGCGLGKYLILYGYTALRQQGVHYGESVITALRDESIMAHYACGFKAQHTMKYISYKGALPNINFIQKLRIRLRLQRMYREFERQCDEKFVSNYIPSRSIYERIKKADERAATSRGIDNEMSGQNK